MGVMGIVAAEELLHDPLVGFRPRSISLLAGGCSDEAQVRLVHHGLQRHLPTRATLVLVEDAACGAVLGGLLQSVQEVKGPLEIPDPIPISRSSF